MRIEIVKIGQETAVNNFTSPVLHIRVDNTFDQVLTIDGFENRIVIEVLSAERKPLLEIDETMRLRMLYCRGLRKPGPARSVAAQSGVVFTLNLAQYYYPFATGSYYLVPHIDISGSGRISGEAVAMNVEAAALEQAVTWFQDPVFGSDSLFCRMASGGQFSAYLRWLGLNNPLAAFHNTLLEGAPAFMNALPATPSFKQLDAFEPGFDKNIVWHDGTDGIVITRYRDGRLQSSPLEIKLPVTAVESLIGASYTEDNTFLVFGIERTAMFSRSIVGFRIGNSGRAERFFAVSLPAGYELIQVQCYFDYILLVAAGADVRRIVFDHAQNVLDDSVLTKLNGKPKYLYMTAGADCVRVAYLADNRTAGVFETSLFPRVEETDGSDEDGTKASPLSGEFRLALEPQGNCRQITFLFDYFKRPHIVYTTSRGRLIYRSHEGTYHRIAREPLNCQPAILDSGREGEPPFIGFFTSRTGYRYYQATADFCRYGINGVNV